MPHARALGTVLAAVLLATVFLAPAASAAPVDLLYVRELSEPEALYGLAPGDSAEWAAEVTNVGTAADDLSVRFEIDGPDSLSTDPLEGLQLVVDLCTSAFIVVDRTLADGRSITRYLCPVEDIPLGVGPAATIGPLGGVRPVASGETIGVRVRVAFPESATNELEDTDAALRVIVVEADDVSGGDGNGNGNGEGDGVGNGDGAGGTVGGGSVAGPGAAAPGSVTLPGGLAVTGRDLGAAVLGGLVALGAGTLLAAAGRRRREREERRA